jgi:hypothetical protein
MKTSFPCRPARRQVGRRLSSGLLVATLVIFVSTAARAQDPDSSPTTADRNWQYPSHGPTRSEAKAADPNRSTWDLYPWHASVSGGPAWFGGENLSGSPAFVAEGRLAKDLTDEAYVVAAYDFVLVESETEASSLSSEWHDLHAFTFGAGFRLPLSQEVHFFFEPRGGVLFGSDADVAPVGMLSAGLEAMAAEGITVRFAITGLATGTDISRNGTDARVESGIIGTFGISFEF